MRAQHHNRSNSRRLTSRPGLTLVELTIAVAVFSVLLATSMKMIFVASSQMRANERRNVALQAVQAVSEQIENMPWDQLTTEAASQIAIPELAMPYLPGGKLNVAVNEETDPPAKRVVVEITWNGRGGQRSQPVRLTSWFFPEDVEAIE
jgi:prepilin-type N-terminal cleavage/methylation domain-containing protein